MAETVALVEKLSDNVQLTTMYSYGGALIPSSDTDDFLRDVLRTVERHSAGASVTAKVPHTRINTLDASAKLEAVARRLNRTALPRPNVPREQANE